MRYCNVGEVCIDDLYNLIIVIFQPLKLEVKVVQPSNKLHFGRIASDDNEFFAKESFDDKPAAVMLQSGFAEQLVEADVLHLVKPERVLITRSFRLPDISVCQFSVGIHIWLKKGSRLGSDTGLAGRAPLSDKCQFVGQRYSSLFLCRNKNPRRKIFCKNFEKPPLRLPGPGLSRVQYYNRAGAKTNPRCGLERSGADIGTEVFLSVVSCSMKGRFSYSVHYPDINRMK